MIGRTRAYLPALGSLDCGAAQANAVGFQYQLGHASHSIKATRWSGSAVPANSKRSNFHPLSLALPGSQTQTMNMAHRSSPCDHPSVSARNCSGSNSAGCQPSSFRARQGNDLASRKIRSVDWFVCLGFIHSIDCCLYGSLCEFCWRGGGGRVQAVRLY